MGNVIAEEYLHEVCRPGQGANTCRYIAASARGITCEKHTSLGAVIDGRVGTMHAKADNCEGLWPTAREGK